MELQSAIQKVFGQLVQSIDLLNNDQYTQPSDLLFNATIGQHVRHIIELFTCVQSGYVTGKVNYDKRKRDLNIETDCTLAIQLLKLLWEDIDKPNKSLLLESSFDKGDGSSTLFVVQTNYYREIIYNLEHSIHHMALIRIGLREMASIEVPEDFGVAHSTIQNRKLRA